MKLYSNILCDPPLGQCTTVPNDRPSVEFTVLIESDTTSANLPLDVSVWHNCNTSGEWTDLILRHDDACETLSVQSSRRPKAARKSFRGTLQKPQIPAHCFKFTVRYRQGPNTNWTWVNQQFGKSDGELLFQPSSLPSDPWYLFPYLEGNEAFTIEPVSSDSPQTRLWHLQHIVPAAGSAGQSTYATFRLGKAVKQNRYFALTRLWTPWIVPEHGRTKFDVSKDGLVCSFLRTDGLHVVLLAVSGLNNVQTYFKSSPEEDVLVESRSDGTATTNGDVVMGVGFQFETALAACSYFSRKLVSISMKSSNKEHVAASAPADNVDAEWYVEWADGLTYCTWNSLGQQLTEAKLLQAVDDLDKNGIQIANLIIDDNWQSIDPMSSQFDTGWTAFEANKEGFPDGLRETVSRIRRKIPRLQTIAVWHAILGYWGGVSPKGEIAKVYQTKEVMRSEMRQPNLTHPRGPITIVYGDDIQRMYNDFYDFLNSCGINAVKTDAQFLIDQLESPEDRRACIKAYQDAWSVSGLRHFQNKQISCMSQVPEIIFHSQLPINKPRVMLRNSDDFFPDVPDSHPWHIFSNGYAATFTQYLNVIPDWDMFQTLHPYASYHAAARCISGGPVYITDEPGKHDLDVIAAISARTTQEQVITLRPSRVAKVIESQVYNAYEDRRLLKISSYNGGKGTGVGFLGLWNTSETAATDFVRLDDFPGIEPDTSYVVRSYTTGQISSPTSGAKTGPIVDVFLEEAGWEILTAHALHKVPEFSSQVASLGLLKKMSGAAATLRFEVEALPGPRLKMTATVKALGVLGIYVSDLEEKSVEGNFLITLQGETVPVATVMKSEECAQVLMVDIERAWSELGMKPGWGNEALVTFYMN